MGLASITGRAIHRQNSQRRSFVVHESAFSENFLLIRSHFVSFARGRIEKGQGFSLPVAYISRVSALQKQDIHETPLDVPPAVLLTSRRHHSSVAICRSSCSQKSVSYMDVSLKTCSQCLWSVYRLVPRPRAVVLRKALRQMRPF